MIPGSYLAYANKKLILKHILDESQFQAKIWSQKWFELSQNRPMSKKPGSQKLKKFWPQAQSIKISDSFDAKLWLICFQRPARNRVLGTRSD